MQLTYEDLRICHSLAVEAREIMDRVDAMEAFAARSTPQYGATAAGPVTHDRVGDGAAQIVDYMAGRREVACAYFEHAAIVEAAIDGIKDSTQRRVMRLRYVDGMRWEQIQLITKYAEAQVYRIHAEALDEMKIAKDDSK